MDTLANVWCLACYRILLRVEMPRDEAIKLARACTYWEGEHLGRRAAAAEKARRMLEDAYADQAEPPF